MCQIQLYERVNSPLVTCKKLIHVHTIRRLKPADFLISKNQINNNLADRDDFLITEDKFCMISFIRF